MKIVKTITDTRSLRSHLTGSVGLVPTMGYLHQGHLSLVRQAKMENDVVIVSIFVNPTQFAPSEDYTTYPRDLERDLSLLQKEKTDIVFIPSAEEMYPKDFNSWIKVDGISERLEGASRPGHFQGVTTVVTKLFNIVQPTRAYFGQKDAQQAMVIKKMVKELNMNLEVIVSATIREADGLAMSSRNTYLSQPERQAATILYKALTLARELYKQGEKDAEVIQQQLVSLIGEEPLAKIEYVSIADRDTLQELSIIDRPVLVLLAVKIGRTRLIDNMLLE